MQQRGKKYWETIADWLHAQGWSYGIWQQISPDGKTLHCIDARLGEGPRYIVRSDELLTGFLELEQQAKEVTK